VAETTTRIDASISFVELAGPPLKAQQMMWAERRSAR
jgi:hypothetical protein